MKFVGKLFFVAALLVPSIASACDASLWQHVYKPQRLVVKKSCVSVTGVIVDATIHEKRKRKDGMRHEPDGDTHGWLKLDPGQQSFLNKANLSAEDGNLVFEVICKFTVRQLDAIAACKDFRNSVVIPSVGSHVRITGAWVRDMEHARWNEIHPVSNIEVL